MISNKADKCIKCGQCTKNCSFLQKYNMNVYDFARRSELMYSCFMCKKCKIVCPMDIDGSEVALEFRQAKVSNNKDKIDGSKYKLLLLEKNPYRFQNYKLGKHKSVIFPGCNFTSFFPKTTKRIEEIAKENNLGIIYDCCGKPIYELGLEKDNDKNLRKMQDKFKNLGVEELILLCPNCYHFFNGKLNIKLTTIYEKLEELKIGIKIKEEIPLYYPCPDKENKEIFNTLKPFLEGEVTNDFDKVQCCGLGGLASFDEGELAKEMAESPKKYNEDKLVTYCATCVGNFKRKGYKNAKHLLPMILEVQEDVPVGFSSIINRAKKKLI